MYKLIVLLSITTAFFHGPIKVMVGLISGLSWSPISLPLLLAGLLIKLGTANSGIFKEVKLSWFDVAMAVWLMALLLSFVVTVDQLGNLADALNCMIYPLAMPLGYILFRFLIAECYGIDFLGSYILKLLKISVIWIIVEFILVNMFDLQSSIEALLNPILNSGRIYDGLGGVFVKAAGPIVGPQNGSVISAIAMGIFGRSYLLIRTKSHLIWLVGSVLAFLCTFTLTGLLLLALVQFIFWHNRKRWVSRVPALLMLAGISALGIHWLDSILSLKTGLDSYDGQLIADYVRMMIGDNIWAFLLNLYNYPLGIGWAQNSSDQNILYHAELIGPEINQEIFLLRLIAFGGVPMLVALILFFVTAIIQYHRVQLLIKDKKVALQSYFIIVSSIIFSSLHYPSMLTPALVILFAAVCAQLACYTKVAIRFRKTLPEC